MLTLTQAAPVSRTDDDHSLAALRREIDETDDAILALLDRRQTVAKSIHAYKADPLAGLALRPDREAFVLSRLIARVSPEQRPTALAIWREVLGAGLAAQGRLKVVSWSPKGLETELAARLRFSAAAQYRPATSAEAALDAAEQENAVAVLGLDREHPWWAALPARESLWIFDALAGWRGRDEPVALAVGRVPIPSLARGVSFRVSMGGDSGSGSRGERMIASGPGSRLYAVEDGRAAPELDRAFGFVGAAPSLA